MLPEPMFIDLYQDMFYWDDDMEWVHENVYYEEPPEDLFINPDDEDFPDWVDDDGTPHWLRDET